MPIYESMKTATERETLPKVSWSRGRLEQLGACPGCGRSVEPVAEYFRQDDTAAMEDCWRMVRCGECGSLYLNPRPDKDSLPAAYATYYTHQPEEHVVAGDSTTLQTRLINGYLNWRFGMSRQPAAPLGALLFLGIPPLRQKLDVYGRNIPRSMCRHETRLLDVGCGSGTFLLRAREMGIQAMGCEPDPRAVETCRAQGLDVLAGDIFASGLNETRFDLITVNHVIEHVYEPIALLQRALHLLRPGGILWLGLPNPGALGLALFGQGWKGLHPPFHLTIPTQRLLAEWVSKAGFVDVRLLCRGAQSPGLWRESAQIAKRERVRRAGALRVLFQLGGDVLSTITPKWGEETILVARKAEVE